MTQTSRTAAIGDCLPSLRERKKLATRRALRSAALSLIAERGYARVTVEDIAAAADVSPRTFFNYFASKEAALFGADPARSGALRARLLDQVPGESALDALRAALTGEAGAIAAEFAALDGDPAGWLEQMKAAHADPDLQAARAAHMAAMEATIAGALTDRLGTDAAKDPYPLLLASAGMAVLRTALSFWARAGGSIALDRLTAAAFAALAGGLAEDSALRSVTATAAVSTPASS